MITNFEWLQSLAVDNPHELQAWFDAEHMSNDDLGAKNDVSERVDAVTTETCDNDSREKLEADAIQLAQNIWHQGQNYANGVREMRHIAWQERDVIELLDRQAEITEQQTERKWCCYEGSVQSEIDKLATQVDNLARDLQESERLREEMREELSIAYDYAHDLLARRDRGLA